MNYEVGFSWRQAQQEQYIVEETKEERKKQNERLRKWTKGNRHKQQSIMRQCLYDHTLHMNIWLNPITVLYSKFIHFIYTHNVIRLHKTKRDRRDGEIESVQMLYAYHFFLPKNNNNIMYTNVNPVDIEISWQDLYIYFPLYSAHIFKWAHTHTYTH